MRRSISNDGKVKVVKTTIQLFILIVLLSVTTNGCVKQNKCDCPDALTGTWQYLEEPIYKEVVCSDKKAKIVAVFTTEKGGVMLFTNPVPLRYQSLIPINVRLCAKDECQGKIHPSIAGPVTYKLTCIEKED